MNFNIQKENESVPLLMVIDDCLGIGIVLGSVDSNKIGPAFRYYTVDHPSIWMNDYRYLWFDSAEQVVFFLIEYGYTRALNTFAGMI